MSNQDWLVFLVVQAAMVATAFWEAYIEGADGWAKNQVGWKVCLGKFTYTAYHFWLYWVMFPLLLALPLVVIGWDGHLFWVLVFSYLVGATVEDFLWFVVNPVYPLRKFNPVDCDWHPWIILGRFYIPTPYVIRLVLAVLVFALFLG
ncbi:MAG: hypothetical protein CEN89_763 [Candidatus Berkelbacteria bacterium Licking1014_7]|uniref:Uncharacterized protein n=1 Tax=Candidatus Berkelbacteria bacterium Licking1014_7 TaxID=2017147 RepID=A0A554LHI7_9BACT|nr:MAG: hypothetical protein CEN89_763 [Candidatus Berkelbacteria bacterium Licking1014_7]